MTPLQYAERLVASYQLRKFDDDGIVWRFQRLCLKGQKHEPRKAIDKFYGFHRLLPTIKIVLSQTGRVGYFVPQVLFDHYCQELWMAGLNPDAHAHQLNERFNTRSGVIVSKSSWHAAVGFLALTKEIMPLDDTVARRNAGLLKARQTRLQNEARRELLKIEVLKQRERAALAAIANPTPSC